MSNNLIAFIVLYISAALITVAVAILWGKIKASKTDLISQKRALQAEIKTQGKAMQEWNETLTKEVMELKTTTVKAVEKNGELFIMAPDGITTIDEFKINKE